MSHSIKIKGVGVSPGIAIGKAHLLERSRMPIPYYTLFGEDAVSDECKRFEAAVAKAEEDLEVIKRGIHPDFKEHAHVLEVHQMILRDRLFYTETLRLIQEEKLNAQWALTR